MNNPDLPTEEERIKLCDLMHEAFVELRHLDGQQSRDLAYAFHNIPKEMYGWGSWSPEQTRRMLQRYQDLHSDHLGINYVEKFNEIYPEQN